MVEVNIVFIQIRQDAVITWGESNEKVLQHRVQQIAASTEYPKG